MSITAAIRQRIHREQQLIYGETSPYRRQLHLGRAQGLREALRLIETYKARLRAERTVR